MVRGRRPAAAAVRAALRLLARVAPPLPSERGGARRQRVAARAARAGAREVHLEGYSYSTALEKAAPGFADESFEGAARASAYRERCAGGYSLSFLLPNLLWGYFGRRCDLSGLHINRELKFNSSS